MFIADEEHVPAEDSLENSPLDLAKCEICDKEFFTKTELHTHQISHLGQPRIVLKRCADAKPVKKKDKKKDTYWLDPETKGSLKLTLKKQQLPDTDALKFTLKKSSQSEDFAVVNTNLDLDRNEENCYEEEEEEEEEEGGEEEVADSRDNETADEVEADIEPQTFENVMVNEEVRYKYFNL